MVVSVPAQIVHGGIFVRNSLLDPQELRFSLLFWDKLDFPQSNILGIGNSSEGELAFLLGAGVLSRTKVFFQTSFDQGETLVDTHVSTFNGLDNREPGKWSLARGERSLGFRPEEVVPDHGLQVQLFEALPVPDKEVPLDDILQFKQKRRPELLTLRRHLEDIYLEVQKAPERALAGALAVEKLDAAVRDVLKTASESKMKLKLSGFDASLQLFDVNQALMTGGAVWEAGLGTTNAVLAGLVGGLVPKLTFKTGVGLKRETKEKKGSTPFEYVSRFHRDLFPK